MARKILLSALLLVWVFFFGCRTHPEQIETPYDRPLPPGAHALRKITDPAEIPDFTMACLDLKDLLEAVGNSLSYLSKPSSRGFFPSGEITHARAVESLEAFGDLLDSGLRGRQLNQAIREKFDVYISVAVTIGGRCCSRVIIRRFSPVRRSGRRSFDIRCTSNLTIW